ncbi:MAG: hypothetical protein LBE54_11855 [Brucellaceae bacterium]|nr:hypothetical protein [Brucellaceae bacterium]
MGMFIALWLLDFALIRTDWCGSEKDKCFREWVGALSGWVAAVGALGAALLTLPHLRQQASEAKRQADFALGESLPTFDVYTDGSDRIHFRIVNWNRRTLLLDSIRTTDAWIYIEGIKLEHAGIVDQVQSKFDDEDEDTVVFIPSIRIAAYDDRNTAPAICTITAYASVEEGTIQIAADFKAEGRLLGESHGYITLEASAVITPFQ